MKAKCIIAKCTHFVKIEEVVRFELAIEFSLSASLADLVCCVKSYDSHDAIISLWILKIGSGQAFQIPLAGRRINADGLAFEPA